MTKLMLNLLTRLHKDEAGQGLVEYLLILALVAFAATAGMGSLASGLNSAFSAGSNVFDQCITQYCRKLRVSPRRAPKVRVQNRRNNSCMANVQIYYGGG